MKRVFVAIKISDKAKREVSSYIKTLEDGFKNLRVGWVKDEKLHLTLKFLGDIEDEKLLSLENAVRQVSQDISNFKLKISEIGVFPNPRKPRILWLGIEDAGNNLSKAKKSLEEKCSKFGINKEKRNFKPHLTIARIRQSQKSKKLVKTHLQNKFEPVEFEVSEIVIYESKLLPTGSVYSVLAEYKLGN